MINKENKQSYIELFNTINTQGMPLEDITTFISTFDGSNELEFKKLIVFLVTLISSYNILKADSDTLRQLEELDETFKQTTESMRQKYKDIKDGNFPSNIAVSSNLFDTLEQK